MHDVRKTTALTRRTFVGKVMSLLFNMLHYLYYLHHSLASAQTTGREHSPSHQQKIGLKTYWAWTCPSEQDTVSSSVSFSHQDFSISFLFLSIRGKYMKTIITENWSYWSHGPQPCLTQWNYEPCCVRATHDGWVMVESSEKMWSTGEGNGKPLQYSCLENPMNSMKRQKDRTLKDELPRVVGAQYAAGGLWRNNSRKNREMESKQKQHPAVDVTDYGSKVQCCKEQYCIGIWNVRSMNQGKLEVVKQEMARVNVNIWGISELKWTGMGEFNSDDHYIYYCGQGSLRFGSSVHGISPGENTGELPLPPPVGGSHQARNWTHASYVSWLGRWVLYH